MRGRRIIALAEIVDGERLYRACENDQAQQSRPKLNTERLYCSWLRTNRERTHCLFGVTKTHAQRAQAEPAHWIILLSNADTQQVAKRRLLLSEQFPYQLGDSGNASQKKIVADGSIHFSCPLFP